MNQLCCNTCSMCFGFELNEQHLPLPEWACSSGTSSQVAAGWSGTSAHSRSLKEQRKDCYHLLQQFTGQETEQDYETPPQWTGQSSGTEVTEAAAQAIFQNSSKGTVHYQTPERIALFSYRDEKINLKMLKWLCKYTLAAVTGIACLSKVFVWETM